MQKDKFYKPQSFPIDPREFDPYRGTRVFSDFFQLEDWTGYNTTTSPTDGVAPSAASTFDYTDARGVVAGVGSVGLAAAKDNGTKSEIRDRTSNSVNPGIMFGKSEMDFVARCKWFTSASEQTFRVGFYDDVADLSGTNESRYGLYFFVKNAVSTTNLYLGIFNDWTGTASATSYKFVKDTGIVLDSYRTLGIFVNKDATDVVFTIDGVVVHRQSNDIPNYLRGSWVGTAARRLQCGIALQATATTTNSSSASIDYMQFRHFTDRNI